MRREAGCGDAARFVLSLVDYFSRIVTPPTAADTSAPTFGPLS
jgi:hypothetical protein